MCPEDFENSFSDDFDKLWKINIKYLTMNFTYKLLAII